MYVENNTKLLENAIFYSPSFHFVVQVVDKKIYKNLVNKQILPTGFTG